MEEELKCPFCKNFYNCPVILNCYHSLCFNCALSLQHPREDNSASLDRNLNRKIDNIGMFTSDLISLTKTYATSSSSSSEISEADKLSLISETDSGVICTSTRPEGCVNNLNLSSFLFSNVSSLTAFSLSCPICHKLTFLDEKGASSLSKNQTLANIVQRYQENLSSFCQLCEQVPKEATLMCEQCEIFYCHECKENFHPSRGPLAKHTLIDSKIGRSLIKNRNQVSELKCNEHREMSLTSFCLTCKLIICCKCIQENRHQSHNIYSLSVICKAQKASENFFKSIFFSFQTYSTLSYLPQLDLSTLLFPFFFKSNYNV